MLIIDNVTVRIAGRPILDGASADTLVLHHGGVDQVSGFDATTDVLDLRALFREASVSPDAATTNVAALLSNGAIRIA